VGPAHDLEQLAHAFRVGRPEARAMSERGALAGLTVFGRGAGDLERARELRIIERWKHDRERERPRPGAEERLVQIGIERGELLLARLLRQIGVRPEPLQRTGLRRIGVHERFDIVLQNSMPDFRVIPSIDQLRQRTTIRALESRYGADATVEALRAAAGAIREAIAHGDTSLTTDTAVVSRIEAIALAHLADRFRPSLVPVINATGVVLHTNLGRAPLASAAIDRIAAIARGYSTLEYDLARGARGRRDRHAEALLRDVTGAEAAVVVNNNAAATLLVLAALAAGREVIVSRGELVEIGGGFRVPDVMAQSGAVLREVGTTNKTRAADYAAAISERTALILRVHPSNFRIEGFTERPALAELVAVARKFNVPVAEDLGSGHLVPRKSPAGARRVPGECQGGAGEVPGECQEGAGEVPGECQAGAGEVPGECQGSARHRGGVVERVHHALWSEEPAVQDSGTAGVDVCCFSGDKLLGGPQAGVIVGRTELVERIRRHPLMRALRVDKLTYAALEATLAEYIAGRAAQTIPVQRMIAMTADEIRARADALADRLRATDAWRAELIAGASAVGGGSAPGVELPTWLVAVDRRGMTAAALEERLRGLTPPVVARIEGDRVVLDLRTVLPDQDLQLAALVTSV
jgi:L-seryl-tRNA(Ser) seleniumtransferase